MVREFLVLLKYKPATLLSRSMVNVAYFCATQNIAMTIFGVVAGGIMRYHRRYKVCLCGSPFILSANFIAVDVLYRHVHSLAVRYDHL